MRKKPPQRASIDIIVIGARIFVQMETAKCSITLAMSEEAVKNHIAHLRNASRMAKAWRKKQGKAT